MPELPEVHTVIEGIKPFLINQTIIKTVVRKPKLRWKIPKEIIDLHNEKIKKVERRGKYIIINLKTGNIILHLGMSGNLRIFKKNQPVQKHDHIDFILNKNTLLRFNDPRRFGCVLWCKKHDKIHPLLKKLGKEPLSAEFDAQYLWEKIKKRNINIKQAIMDQKLVVGVGNIYVNESLFLAKISPFKVCKELNFDDCTRLVNAIKKVLLKAIKYGGSSIKDFIKSDGKPGYFAQKLLVYGRNGLPCPSCKKPLMALQLDKRTTVFCLYCQH